MRDFDSVLTCGSLRGRVVHVEGLPFDMIKPRLPCQHLPFSGGTLRSVPVLQMLGGTLETGFDMRACCQEHHHAQPARLMERLRRPPSGLEGARYAS